MRAGPGTATLSGASAFATLSPGGVALEPRVTDAMHWELAKCRSDASLKTFAALINDERVHCVVVIDDPSDLRSLWGVISDLDLIAAASVRRRTEQVAGGTAMTPAVTVGPDERLEHAAYLMTKHGAAHLVVVDPIEQRPVGVLSTLDLAAVLAAA